MKRILCILLTLSLALTMVGCGQQIDDNPIGDDITNDNTQNTNQGGEEAPGEDQSENSYPFDLGFIEDNGLEYIWAELDEDTRYNLGEVMNAIKNVEIYCSLSVGVPGDEITDFLALVSNCTTGYTYASSTYRKHMDDETGKVVGITLMYDISYEEEALARTEAIKQRVQQVVSGMPDGTDYEKLLYLHDWLVLNCDYSTEAASPFSAFGALIEGKATCQGYADAMHLLLAGAGFETVFITGIGDNTSVTHKWNYVKTSDGTWYVIDPTWGDPDGKDDLDYICYDYFMIDNTELLKGHVAVHESRYYTLPEADSMDLNYHIMSGYYAETFDDVVRIIEEQATANARDGKKYIYLRCATEELHQEAKEKLFSGEYEMQKILLRAKDATGADELVTNSWTKTVKDDILTMTITLKYNKD